jgi:hypothetical protein
VVGLVPMGVHISKEFQLVHDLEIKLGVVSCERLPRVCRDMPPTRLGVCLRPGQSRFTAFLERGESPFCPQSQYVAAIWKISQRARIARIAFLVPIAQYGCSRCHAVKMKAKCMLLFETLCKRRDL